MNHIWYFVLYSILGFLLEVGYARCTGGRRDRKRTLLLPLCPVYGLGALAVLALPEAILVRPLLLMAFGGVAATGVEYLTALFYETVLGVSFWDYRELAGTCMVGYACHFLWLGPPCCRQQSIGCIRLRMVGRKRFRPR